MRLVPASRTRLFPGALFVLALSALTLPAAGSASAADGGIPAPAGVQASASAPLQSAAPATPAASAPASTAQVAGLWCGDGLLASYRLELTQQAQGVSGRIHRRERSWPITGHLTGGRLTTEETPVGSLVLERQVEPTGAVLRLVGGKGPVALAAGTRFTAAKGGVCGQAVKP